jgi:hypothetical protein
MGWIEDFTAAMCGNREHGAGLRKIMRTRKAATDGRSPEATQLSASIPPFGNIHLAIPSNNEPEFQQSIEIYYRFHNDDIANFSYQRLTGFSAISFFAFTLTRHTALSIDLQ